MKARNLFTTLFAILIICSVQTFAQPQGKNDTNPRTETIKVQGACGMCETRIEKAAKLDGVSKADWDKATKTLTVVYDPSKVTNDDIQKKIASVGHDTEKFKADDKVYDGLPGCCKYR